MQGEARDEGAWGNRGIHVPHDQPRGLDSIERLCAGHQSFVANLPREVRGPTSGGGCLTGFLSHLPPGARRVAPWSRPFAPGMKRLITGSNRPLRGADELPPGAESCRPESDIPRGRLGRARQSWRGLQTGCRRAIRGTSGLPRGSSRPIRGTNELRQLREFGDAPGQREPRLSSRSTSPEILRTHLPPSM